jgi:hypothetical protein
LPDRTLDPAKRRASTNRRKIRWRAKHKELARLAALEEKRLHREALDAARVAAGKLPLREARVASLAKFRQKVADTKAMISLWWFAPEIDFDAAVNARVTESPNLDSSTVRSFVEACARNCRAASVNMNAFTMEHGAHTANHKRVIFHELIEKGVPLSEAAQRCHRESFKPSPLLSGVAQALDTGRRFDEAKEKWQTGDAIVAELLGRGASRIQPQ